MTVNDAKQESALAKAPGHVLNSVELCGIKFDLAESDEPARFVLGLRKSGSTLLSQIMAFIARNNSLHSVDLPGTFFKHGLKVADWQDSDLASVVRPGNMYLGFRNLPTGLPKVEVFNTSKRIFMFRDPRDALVSQYFSDAYSHSLPSAKSETADEAKKEFMAKRQLALGTDINDYVLAQAGSMNWTFTQYAEVLKSPLTLPLRYEEYIFTKKRMIMKIIQHFDLNMQKGAIEALLAQVDIVPGSEDAKKFVRNVIPGDHRRKLLPETIEKLDRRLEASLKLYDYY